MKKFYLILLPLLGFSCTSTSTKSANISPTIVETNISTIIAKSGRIALEEPKLEKCIYLNADSALGVELYKNLKADGWKIFDMPASLDTSSKTISFEEKSPKTGYRNTENKYNGAIASSANKADLLIRHGKEGERYFITLIDSKSSAATIIMYQDGGNISDFVNAFVTESKNNIRITYPNLRVAGEIDDKDGTITKSEIIEVKTDGSYKIDMKAKCKSFEEFIEYVSEKKRLRDTEDGYKIQGGDIKLYFSAPWNYEKEVEAVHALGVKKEIKHISVARVFDFKVINATTFDLNGETIYIKSLDGFMENFMKENPKVRTTFRITYNYKTNGSKETAEQIQKILKANGYNAYAFGTTEVREPKPEKEETPSGNKEAKSDNNTSKEKDTLGL